MSNLNRKFLKVLLENDAERDMEREAMKSMLDDGTDPVEFDARMPELDGSDEVASAISRRNKQDLQNIDNWIRKCEEFLRFINSDDPNSIQTILAAAIPDTILDKVKTSQQAKIARVASEIAALNQSLLGFKAQSTRPTLRGV